MGRGGLVRLGQQLTPHAGDVDSGAWWEYTSKKMNSDPVSACWPAAVSSGGGAANLPPRPGAHLLVRSNRAGSSTSRRSPPLYSSTVPEPKLL